MKRIKNFLPAEFYLILIPSIVLFIFSFFYLKNISINAFEIKSFVKVFVSSKISGANFILLLFLFLCIIIETSLLIVHKTSLEKDKQIKKTWQQIFSIFLIVSVIFLAGYSLLLSTNLIFRIADPTKTAELSKLLLGWDKSVFKIDPGIWLINQFSGTFIEKYLLWIYINIFEVLSLIFLLSFFFSKKAFRRLILSFFICWIIALPIWFIFPAISPAPMFRQNDLKMATAEQNKVYNSIPVSSLLKENLDLESTIHVIDTDPNNIILPTSTFPSMHAAWGVVMAYAGTVLWPPLGIILFPLSIANGVSSIYILEHYSSDIFLGFIISLISIAITEMSLNFEKNHFEDKFNLLSGFDYVPSTIKKVKNIINKIKSWSSGYFINRK